MTIEVFTNNERYVINYVVLINTRRKCKFNEHSSGTRTLYAFDQTPSHSLRRGDWLARLVYRYKYVAVPYVLAYYNKIVCVTTHNWLMCYKHFKDVKSEEYHLIRLFFEEIHLPF